MNLRKDLKKSACYLLILSMVSTSLGTSVFATSIVPTKITKQPTDVSVDYVDKASFEIGAEGTGLQYEWYIGDELKSTDTDNYGYSGSFDLDRIQGFNASIDDSNVYTYLSKDLANENTSSFKTKSFTIPKESKFTFDYKASFGKDDSAKLEIYNANDDIVETVNLTSLGDDITKVKSKSKEVTLEAGTYYVIASYVTGDVDAIDSNNNSVIFTNFALDGKNIQNKLVPLKDAILFGTDEKVTIDKTNEAFFVEPEEDTLSDDDVKTSSREVICKVIGGDEQRVYSNPVKLNVSMQGTEVTAIDAIWDGTIVKVGKDISKDNLIVKTTTKDYKTNKTTEGLLNADDYTLNKTLVSAKGDNEFVVTYGDLTDSFIVSGAEEPSNALKLMVTAKSPNSVTITWEAPENVNGAPITSYNIYLNDVACGNVLATKDLTFTKSDLKSNTSYKISVAAVNAAGESTKVSQEFTTDAKASSLTCSIDKSKLDVLVGDSINANDISFVVTYSDGTTKNVSYKDLSIVPSSLKVTKAGENSFDFGYQDATATLKVNGYEPDTIQASYSDEYVEVGKEIDLNKLSVVYFSTTLADGNTKKVSVSDYSFDSKSKKIESVGDNKFTISYEGKTCELVVKGAKVTDKVKNIKIGNITDNSATVTWEAPENVNGAPITSYKIYLGNDLLQTVTDLKSLNTKLSKLAINTEYSLSITAVNAIGESEKVSTTFKTSKKISSIKAEYAKESVLVGSEFDTSKVVITAVYEDNTTGVIDYKELTTVPSSKVVANKGNNNFEVSYNDLKATLVVHGYEVSGIEATYSGDSVIVNNNFDKAKLTVNLVYTEDVNGKINKQAITDYTLGDNMKVTNIGNNTFTVTYKNKTATFVVVGADDTSKTITSIKAEYAKESVLVGNEFDTSKVVTTITYNDNTTATVSYDKLASGPSSKVVANAGWNEYTLMFRNSSATLKVHGYKVDRIEATYSGDNVVVGNDIDKTKVVVKAIYTEDVNGKVNSVDLTDYTLSTTKIDKEGDNVITVTYKDKTTTFVVKGVKNNTSVGSNNGGNVQTGDTSELPLFGALFVVSIFGLVLCLKKKK